MFNRNRAANKTSVRRAEVASSPKFVLLVQPKDSATQASSNVRREYFDVVAVTFIVGLLNSVSL
jgi:hypothetical protein